VGRVGPRGVHRSAAREAPLPEPDAERWHALIEDPAMSMLMAAVLDSLRGRGCTEATLRSFAANEGANAFYESAGFTRDGAEKSEETWAHMPEVRYRRTL
jgi:GNAT superfamily N-acetyltransferase